ncbi:RecQ family ATP-dependent DNA helicase [Levilactobacillus yiduensis]|uniref:RecQ family ATP-dependent DNA helicase n=1 Tax=Levilactobacillus yiduensis TaxID=2953880 RepID=UPI000EF34D63|nr:RecQ family ATP-dependent DNA helicase [Levilactobacillus yiduensis]AYM03228.1 ATP-dependent DNA helicase RecQ [Levilactobacillus brevis]
MEPLMTSLKRVFGFDHFRSGQEQALTSLEAGHDTLAILPTGAGKTLIYQLYGYRHPGCVLIVSPLLSLMNDQVNRMRMSGFKRAAAITSQTPFGERLSILNHLNQLQFLFLSPEMLAQPQMLARLQQITLSLLVVDEAHCIVQWGPDFRPEYLLLGAIREKLQHPLTLMLTATAGQQTRAEIAKQLRSHPQVVTESVNRPNIYLDVENVADEATKQSRLQDLVAHLRRPGVVYFSSKQQASDTALWLRDTTGVTAAAYHAGLDAEDRFKIQQQFMAGQLDVICATSAFGMGIDKDDVRFVIHYHLPADLESYAQEIGRAGRDGQPSVAILLYAPGDEQLPLALGQSNRPEVDTIQRYYAHPKNFAADDPQIQLLAFYRDHGISEDAVIRLFASREKERNHALAQMLAYVRTETCLRATWLQAFDETSPEHTARCCAPGNVALDLTALGLTRQQPAPTPETVPWQTRLARLF